jgi:hypothetical protein
MFINGLTLIIESAIYVFVIFTLLYVFMYALCRW